MMSKAKQEIDATRREAVEERKKVSKARGEVDALQLEARLRQCTVFRRNLAAYLPSSAVLLRDRHVLGYPTPEIRPFMGQIL